MVLFLVLGKQQKLDIENAGGADDEAATDTPPSPETHEYSLQESMANYNGFSNADHHLD